MDFIYAPWRDEYVKNRVLGCPFCHAVKNADKDESLHVLHRSKNCFLIMNKFPYTPGHFMVIPNLHVDAIEKLDDDIWLEMSGLVQKSVKLLKEDFRADGVNIGMNLGECGGAGIAEHVHYHIVPRWSRDTNFITTIGGSRVYSVDFEKVYEKLRQLIKDRFC